MSNCFGIKQLSQEFAINQQKFTHLIYAPNGSMKTSLAKTLKFLSKQSKEKPCDKLFPGDRTREGSFKISIDGINVKPEQLFVANGDDDIDTSRSFANFLASAELKSRYDTIYGKFL